MVDYASAGILLILVGVTVVAAGLLLSSKPEDRKVKGGGVILLGPIPIAFGSDSKWTSIAIALAIVLILIMLVLYLV